MAAVPPGDANAPVHPPASRRRVVSAWCWAMRTAPGVIPRAMATSSASSPPANPHDHDVPLPGRQLVQQAPDLASASVGESRRTLVDLTLVPDLWKIDGYSKIVSWLGQKLELESGVDLVEFPYDWRSAGELIIVRVRSAPSATDLEVTIADVASSAEPWSAQRTFVTDRQSVELPRSGGLLSRHVSAGGDTPVEPTSDPVLKGS
jgi:hypothetical protein